MTSPIPRLACPEERQALEDLQRRAFLVPEEYRSDLLAHPDAIDMPADRSADGLVYVEEASGNLVGFGVVLPRDGGGVERDGLFVEPSAWRKGIGRPLVDAAMLRAAREGTPALHVISNPLTEAFYRACGFAYSGKTRTRFGSARTMRRARDADATKA